MQSVTGYLNTVWPNWTDLRAAFGTKPFYKYLPFPACWNYSSGRLLNCVHANFYCIPQLTWKLVIVRFSSTTLQLPNYVKKGPECITIAYAIKYFFLLVLPRRIGWETLGARPHRRFTVKRRQTEHVKCLTSVRYKSLFKLLKMMSRKCQENLSYNYDDITVLYYATTVLTITSKRCRTSVLTFLRTTVEHTCVVDCRRIYRDKIAESRVHANLDNLEQRLIY